MRFWDSSAIVPLLVEQSVSGAVADFYRTDARLVVWWGTPVECDSAFARLARMGAIGEAEARRARQVLERLKESWVEVEPTLRLREQARRLVAAHDLTAGDALQLAAALAAPSRSARALEFVCLDRRLRDGAQREGFSLLPV